MDCLGNPTSYEQWAYKTCIAYWKTCSELCLNIVRRQLPEIPTARDPGTNSAKDEQPAQPLPDNQHPPGY